MTDRGPNADAPTVGKQEAKIFANPAFVPLLMETRIGGGKAIATQARPLHDESGPISGLPSIIKWRQPNRGIEGVTRLPDGRILAAVQITLDIDGKSKNQAQFTRLVSVDPASGKTAMYGYPIDIARYQKAKDAKIGDIVAVDNQHILLIEQGSDKDKQVMNKIYLVDLSQASDLASFDVQGKALEFADASERVKRGVKLAQKREVADLRKLGWQQEKVEGLAIISWISKGS